MKRFFCILALGFCLLLSSCGWMLMEVVDHNAHSIPEGKSQAYYVNLFGAGVMSVYYLWCDEIKDGLEKWDAFGDPAETVKTIRYKDSEGNDIDRWTQMFDNYTEMTASVAGTSTTYGFEFSLYYADRAYVFMDKTGTNELKRIVAVGNVALTNDTKRAYGGKAAYYREAGMVVLYAPTSGCRYCEVRDEKTDPPQSVKGEKIKFWIGSEQIQVEKAVINAPVTGDGVQGLKSLTGGK